MSSQSPGNLRSLEPADLESVVEIDRRIIGRSRRVFFEKRLQAALADPAGFIAVAVESGGVLAGFAIGRLQNGEFGDDRRVAVLDVIGVDPDSRKGGLGALLLDGMARHMMRRDTRELRTQVDWHDRNLVQFFAVAGFSLASRVVLERATARELSGFAAQGGNDAMTTLEPDPAPQRMDAGMPDHSGPAGDDFVALPHDRTLVRSMAADDLDAIVRIDAKLTGRGRRGYYQAKLVEMMGETGVRVSLVAEVDGRTAGYIMARVDYGEFGRAEPAAVIDTIGVEPDLGHQGVGAALLSQLMANLDALRVETVRTTVAWNNFALLGFLSRSGFTPAQRLVLGRPVT